MTAKSPARPTRPQPRVHGVPSARRGSIYAVVMGMSIIVAFIGLSTIAVSRINLRSTAVVGESGEAELLAFPPSSTPPRRELQPVVKRTDFTHNVEILLVQPAAYFHLEAAGRDRRQPLRRRAPAGQRRRLRLRRPGPPGLQRAAPAGGPNLLTNGEVEQGLTGWAVNAADCVLESHTTATAAGEVPHGGTRFVWVKSRINQYAGPQQSMLNKITKGSGRSYYFEAWVKMTASPEPVWFTLLIKQGGSGPSDVTEKVRATEVAGTEWTKVSRHVRPDVDGVGDGRVVAHRDRRRAQGLLLRRREGDERRREHADEAVPRLVEAGARRRRGGRRRQLEIIGPPAAAGGLFRARLGRPQFPREIPVLAVTADARRADRVRRPLHAAPPAGPSAAAFNSTACRAQPVRLGGEPATVPRVHRPRPDRLRDPFGRVGQSVGQHGGVPEGLGRLLRLPRLLHLRVVRDPRRPPLRVLRNLPITARSRSSCTQWAPSGSGWVSAGGCPAADEDGPSGRERLHESEMKTPHAQTAAAVA